MRYFVYPSRADVLLSKENYDLSQGILGSLTTNTESIGDSDSLAEAVQLAYAELCRNPTVSLYITDENLVVRHFISHQEPIDYRKQLNQAESWGCCSTTILIFAVVCFIVTIATDFGYMGFIIFLGISTVFMLMVLLKIQTEVESAVVCLIILVLALLLYSAIRDAIDLRQKTNQEGNITCLSNAINYN
jgi:hypothetical protein